MHPMAVVLAVGAAFFVGLAVGMWLMHITPPPVRYGPFIGEPIPRVQQNPSAQQSMTPPPPPRPR